MSFLQWIIENAEIFMATLLVNSFYLALLAAFILGLKVLYPKLPVAIEYALWCMVLVRLVLPIDFSIDYSLGYFSHHFFKTELPELLTSSRFWGDWLQAPVFEESEFSWMKLFVAVWLLVAGLISFKYLALKIKLSKLLAKAHPIEDPWLDKTIKHWRREFGILRQIILIDSDDFLSPFTFGLFTPVIFIPSDLIKDKDHKILEPIIAHELAHIKRLDAAWLVFQNILQILYCFNPMVWLIVRRLNSLREEICDQKVLSQNKINASDYGESLLKVLGLNRGQKSPEHFATFFLSQKKIFKNRIKKICLIGHQSKISNKFQLAFVSLFALFLLPLGYPLVTPQGIAPTFYPNKEPESPFPDEVKKDFQPPVLIQSNKKNKDKDEIEWDG